MKTLFSIFTIVFACLVFVPQTAAQESKWWSAEIDARLQLADKNQSQLLTALKGVQLAHRPGLAFLIQHMPVSDLQALSGEYLVRNVELAYEAIEKAAWGKQIPETVFFNDILPYANIDETREDWRAAMRERCLPIVKDCKTPGEAAQKLNRELFTLINVRYSTSRKKANQSPSESIEQSVASCTGLSILLSDACRSVGVPARLAGIPNWVNKPGNHTWVEVWDKQWQFTGAAEPASEGLNHGWFSGDASLAKNDVPKHRVYATSFAETGMHFPMVWSPENRNVPGLNVTGRYVAGLKPLPANLSRVLVRVRDGQGRRVKCSVRVVAKDDAKSIFEGESRDESFDTNDVLTLELPRNAEYMIELARSSGEGDKSLLSKKTDAGEQTLWDLKVQ